ncbi:uncharacterized protein LOC122919704 [Bufo gargarizans]|uniref:uncharacterized protein LOC122919704 n=1 Tax=Bufo gargarizans TaxID=30331 RepID=UPI001CF483B8|nr:uncharacterized protein LOC122919704 [Bufo gargarizans]
MWLHKSKRLRKGGRNIKKSMDIYVQELTQLRDKLKIDIVYIKQLPLQGVLPIAYNHENPDDTDLPSEERMDELKGILGGECGKTRAVTNKKNLLLTEIEKLRQEYRRVEKDWETRAQEEYGRRTETQIEADSLEHGTPLATSTPRVPGVMQPLADKFSKLAITPEEGDKKGTQLQFPMITVGDTEVHIPLPLGLMKELKDMCPNPKKDPRAAAMFLQKYTAGSQLTMEDIQIILSAIDPDTGSQIDTDEIKKASEKEVRDAGQEVGRPNVWKKFWDKIGVEWMKRYKGDSGLHTMLNTKQEPKEDFYSFCKRLLDLYSSTGMNAPELFKTTCMNNGDPKTTQLIKLVNNEWLTQTVTEFMDDIAKRSASGVFNQKGGVFPLLMQQDIQQESILSGGESNYMMMSGFFRGRDNRRGPRSRGQANYPGRVERNQKQGCFICGSLGHWRRECPKVRDEDRKGYRGRGASDYRGGPRQQG